MASTRPVASGPRRSGAAPVLWLLALLGLCPARPALAQDPDLNALMDLSLEELLSVRVQVGHRAGSDLYGDFAERVTVISGEELRHTGVDVLPKALNLLLPAFTYAFSTLDDLTAAARPFTFDGLRSDQVLVLIDGKRVHRSAIMDTSDTQNLGSASVDLALIPIEAVARVEVLNEDASAQYGSDAIAGAINVVLKASADRSEAVLLAGQRKAGDGELYAATFNLGNGRNFASLDLKSQAFSNTSGLDRRDYYFAGDPRNGTYQVHQIYGGPQDRSAILTLRGAAGPKDDEGLYYLAKLAYKETRTPAFFRLPKDDRNVRSIYPDGFLPMEAPAQRDLFASLGWRGAAGPVQYDLSGTAGYNHVDIRVEDSLNASLGAASPTTFDCGSLTYWQWSLNADLKSAHALGLGAPLELAYGAEVRREGYRIGAGEQASWINGGANILDGPNAGRPAAAGAQGLPGFMPGDAHGIGRTVAALYLEAYQPLVEGLDAKVSLRDDKYSDFGNTLNGKVQLTYRPVAPLTLRASAATGFKAPDLPQIGYSFTAINFNSGNGVWAKYGLFPVDAPLSALLGAAPLKPEKSNRVGLGLTYRPVQALQLSADAFGIRIHDRIALSGAIFNGPLLPSAAQAYMTANSIDSAGYFLNAADTTTKGYELAATLDAPLGAGKATFTLRYQHAETSIDAIHIPAQVAFMGDQLVSRNQQERLKHMLPEDKAVLQARYRQGPLTADCRVSWFGRVLYVNESADPSLDQWFGARATVGVDADYAVGRRLSVGLGASNLLDIRPDYRNHDSVLNGKGNSLPYRAISPFDYTGASYYVRAVASF